MQLPGGVMLNGRQIYDDSTVEIERLREKIRLDFEMPADFFIG
jgi:ABC-type phosphate transport system ATPase subunit